MEIENEKLEAIDIGKYEQKIYIFNRYVDRFEVGE